MLSIKEKDLKNLYEQFCFLNHYTPGSLIDNDVKTKIWTYGFKITDDLDYAEVIYKLCPLFKPAIPSNEELDTKDSVALYMRLNY